MRRRTFEVEKGGPLHAVLAAEAGASLEDAGAWIARGATYVEGRRCVDPDRVVSKGARISLVASEAGREVLAPLETHLPEVLLADAWILAVDKPAGMPAQPTPGRVGESVWDWARAHHGAGVGLVHRLDRETSGVMVFGRTPDAVAHLAAQFRSREAKKEYLAVTGPGIAERGRIELPISPDPSRPGRYRASAEANGKPARTDFTRLVRTEAWALVALFPATGRTHQLRAHLAALGCPIAGDARYGGARILGGQPAARCLLHAHRLTLAHPNGGDSFTLEAPPPADFAPFGVPPA